MAENIPNTPAGAVPPKPAEAAKVQPKKETVRINLPPKPTAAPTIKIPAPAPVAPTAAAAPVAAAAPGAAPAAAPAAPTPAPRPAASAPSVASAPAARPSPAPRPQMSAPAVSGLDKGLAIAVALIGLLVLARVFTL